MPLLRILTCLSGLLLLIRPCEATLVRTDGPARIANPSGTLIAAEGTDADPDTNRHTVQLQVDTTLRASGPTSNSGSFRVRFALTDAANAVLPFQDGAGGSAVILTSGVQTVSLLNGDEQNLVFTVNAEPFVPLDLTKRYRVQAEIQRLVTGVWTQQSVRQGPLVSLIALPETPSPDAPYNIVARVESPALAAPVIFKNADGSGGFAVTGSVALFRYDDYAEAAPDALEVPVTVTLVLHDDTAGADVPLLAPSAVQTVSLPSYVQNGLSRDPATAAVPVALTAEPADWASFNAAHVYSLKLSVSYTEADASEAPALAAPVAVAAPQRLLALSGALRFGGLIHGRFSALTGDPRATFTDNGDGTWDGSVVVAAGNGVIGESVRRFGDGVTPLSVVLFPNGDLACLGGSLGFDTAQTDMQAVNGVRVVRGPASLTNAGLRFAQFGVILPTGMGFTTTAISRKLRATHQWNNLPCGDDLLPLDGVLTIGAAAYSVPALHVVQDGHPVRMLTPGIAWNVAAGTFSLGAAGDAEYVRKIDDQTHQAAIGGLPPGNDGYYRSVLTHQSAVITADPQGRGKLTTALQFGAGDFRAHHPFQAQVAWTGTGTLLLDQGRIDPASSALTQPALTQFPYEAGCSKDGNCALVQAVSWPVLATADWRFTVDGGLRAPVQFAQDEPLRWGKNGNGAEDYAHRTAGFGGARFHMTGVSLRTADIGGNSYPIAQRAAMLHLTGCSAPEDQALLERPGVLPAGPAREGRADYAGLNFRAVDLAVPTATSHLAGGVISNYPLHPAAKYYARFGGVSGRHQAAAGTPGNPGVSTIVMFGFNVSLDGLKLGYLDSQNVFSLTGGAIEVPQPSGFDQTFAELKFDCAGRPRDAVLADDTDNLLVHWNTVFTPLTFRFQPKISGGCPSVDKGALVLGAAVKALALTSQPLHAELGFLDTGAMVTKGMKGDYADVSSELMLPAQLKLKGGSGPDYTLTPHGKGYFSSADPAISGQAAAPGDGWINLYGALDVPFFQDIKVQAQVRNSSNAQGGLVDLMGGWPASDAAGNLQGWGEGAGMARTPFNDVNFDAMQRGYPMGQSLAVYRNPPARQYRPLAEQDWLQVVKLGYSLKWDMAARRFTTLGEESTDLVVVKAKHRLLSLTSSTAEITFGVKIEGFPTLNVSKLLTDQINSGLNGLFTSLSNAGLQASGLNEAVQGFDALVSAQIGDLLSAPLDAALDGADFDFNPLLWSQTGGPTGVMSNGAAKYAEQIAGLAKPIANGQGEFTAALRNRLGQVITALTILEGFIPGESPEQNLVKLAKAVLSSAGDGLNPVLVRSLDLITEAVGTPAQAQKSVPAFEELRLTVARLRTRMVGLRDTLDSVNNPLRAELDRAIGLKANYEAQLQATLSAYFTPLGTTPAAIQAAIAERGLDTMRRELRERVRRVLITSALAGPVQAAIKQYLAEPQAAFRGTLDSLFGEVNRAIRDAVKSAIPEGDANTLGLNSIDAGLGALSSTFKGLGLDGYAQINGDSLQRLRIDGKMVLKAADEMEFRGWLQIDALNAKNPRTKCYCDDPAAMRDGVEVIVGGEAPFNLFAGGGNSTKLRVQGQFAFGSCGPGTPALLGLGGSFFLQGSISVASIEIKELGLTFAFGKASNYFGARARAAFQGYEFAGAFFAGSTCGLAPLLDVDPDIHALLLNPDLALLGPGDDPENTRITGLYVYAEGWMPLNNVIGIPDSCLFSLRAGAGAGPFAFVKSGGQDQLLLGSKQFFGITADILCIAHAEAQVKLLGALRIPLGNDIRGEVKGPSSSLALRLLGLAEFELDIGPCPFCISFSKDVKFHAQVGGDGVSFGFGH